MAFVDKGRALSVFSPPRKALPIRSALSFNPWPKDRIAAIASHSDALFCNWRVVTQSNEVNMTVSRLIGDEDLWAYVDGAVAPERRVEDPPVMFQGCA